MKHVIYHTEYYRRNEMFCQREEESDAYFDTLTEYNTPDTVAQPPIGCRLLQPKLVPSTISKEQWSNLAAKKPDYLLRYATMYDVDDDQYAIYAVYEKVIEKQKAGEVYGAGLSMGENDEVMLDMLVMPTDYELDGEHITRWDEVAFEGTTTFITNNGIAIKSSTNALEDKKVVIHHNGWTIIGKWETMEQVSKDLFVYHCHNSLFRFDVTINIERGSWDGNYESLLHK